MMHIDRVLRRAGGLLFVALLAVVPVAAGAAQSAAQAQAERQAVQPLNNAPFWREVRRGENPNQTTQVRGVETNVLVQSQGQTWREFRNGPITIFGGWLIVVVFLALALLYWWRGPIRLHEPLTGRRIVRFTPWERIVHWTAAISFVILAVSGIVMLFGKYILLPVIGYTVFSWLAMLGKNLHNFVGPVFLVSVLFMFFTYVRDNIPDRTDWLWIRRFGDFMRGRHVPAGRYNAFQKGWFWFGATFLAIILGVTGLILDFPNFDQGRSAMQLANMIHAGAAAIFMAAALGHIYMGTVGAECAYDAMRHGTVDETWAKEHHSLWYEEVKAHGNVRAAGGTVPSGAPAGPIKEGFSS
jgi:formate dehydrogenase subunit gamma